MQWEGGKWEEGGMCIRSLVNARDLHVDCPRVLLETLLVPVLMYSSETML